MAIQPLPREYSSEGRQAFYTNGSELPHDAIAPWLGLRIDTWYMFVLDQLGRMKLGASIYSSPSSIGEDLLQHMFVFLKAFRNVVRLRQLILHHREFPESVSIQSYFLSSHDPNTLLDEASEFVRTTPRTVMGCLAQFDIYVTLRGFDDQFYDRWLPWAGRLFLDGDLINIDKQAINESYRISWQAFLKSVVASLFRQDNRIVLEKGRSWWKQRQENSPMLAGEETFGGDFVTLVTPPDMTPETNTGLFEQNIGRLREAVSLWQPQAGNEFEWNDRVSQDN